MVPSCWRATLEAALTRFTAPLSTPNVDPTIELASGTAICLFGLLCADHPPFEPLDPPSVHHFGRVHVGSISIAAMNRNRTDVNGG